MAAEGLTPLQLQYSIHHIEKSTKNVEAMKCFGKLSRRGRKVPRLNFLIFQINVANRGCQLYYHNMKIIQQKVSAGTATDVEYQLMRFMAPLLNWYTAKEVVSIATQGLQRFDGVAEVEATGFPRLWRKLRDSSVFKIDLAVLEEDFIHEINRKNGIALTTFIRHIQSCIDAGSRKDELATHCQKCRRSLQSIVNFVQTIPLLQRIAGDVAYSFVRAYIGGLALLYVSSPNAKPEDLITADILC